MAKSVKINFETVNKGNYTIIPRKDIHETNTRIQKEMQEKIKLQNEIIERKISVTKRRGFVQIFSDTETSQIIQEFNKDSVFLFLDYLRKIGKIKFKKCEIKDIYKHFLYK